MNLRSGATETIAYTTQVGPSGSMVATVGKERLALVDLDAETRAALVMAEMPGLLPKLSDGEDGGAILELVVAAARELPPDNVTPEGVGRRAALTRTLLAALVGTPSAAVLRAALELVEILALPDGAPDKNVLEERVWTLLAHGRPSQPLRALAEKVGLSVAKS
jgi:hypothetical protein